MDRFRARATPITLRDQTISTYTRPQLRLRSTPTTLVSYAVDGGETSLRSKGDASRRRRRRRRRPCRCLRPASPTGFALRAGGRGAAGRADQALPRGRRPSITSASACRDSGRRYVRPARDASASWPGNGGSPSDIERRLCPALSEPAWNCRPQCHENARKHGLPRPLQPPPAPFTRERSQVRNPPRSLVGYAGTSSHQGKRFSLGSARCWEFIGSFVESDVARPVQARSSCRSRRCARAATSRASCRPRKRSEQPLVSVVQQAYVWACRRDVSTSSLGRSGSGSQAARSARSPGCSTTRSRRSGSVRWRAVTRTVSSTRRSDRVQRKCVRDRACRARDRPQGDHRSGRRRRGDRGVLDGVPQVARRHGLVGVQLAISDAHPGLKAAIARVLGAPRQHCTVHFPQRPARPCSQGSARRLGYPDPPAVHDAPRRRSRSAPRRRRHPTTRPAARTRCVARGCRERRPGVLRLPGRALAQARTSYRQPGCQTTAE